MSAKAILSSKGQLVIPKNFRKKMGLHFGSELVLQLTNKNRKMDWFTKIRNSIK